MKAAERAKDLDDTATIMEKRRIYDNSSKETQDSILRSDFKAALRENRKYDAKQEYEENDEPDIEKEKRESTRRENLHMDGEQQQIDHEKAKKEVDNQEEQIEKLQGDVLSPKQIEEEYGK